MKVEWTKSLTTKLFMLMAISLVITIAGTVYQNSSMFRDFLTRQMEDKTIQNAKETANSIEAILDNWVSVTSIAMHNIPKKKNKEASRFLSNYLAANSEFVSFQVITANGRKIRPSIHSFSQNTGAIRFEGKYEGKKSKNLKNIIHNENTKWVKWLQKQESMRSKYMRNINKQTKLPLSSIAVRYALDNNETYSWAVVTVWQSRLMKAMPHSTFQRSFMLAEWFKDKTRVSLSPVEYRKWKRVYKENLALTNASKANSPFGFKAYEGRDGTPLIGAFHKIKDFGVTVAVSNDARSSYRAIQMIVFKSVMWTLVYLVGFLGISYIASTTLTKNLKRLTAATDKIASGDFQVDLDVKSADEVGLLSFSVKRMSGQIRNLMASKIEQARQEKELETAKLIQETLFPSVETITTDNITVDAKNTAASECGGDWWYHHTTEDGKELLVIADATGHGASAAMVTAMAFSGYNTLIEMYTRHRSEINPSEILSCLNSILYQAGNGKSTMTSLVCLMDPETGELTMANAGHNLPFIIPKDATDPRLKNSAKKKRKKRALVIQAGGSPMGNDLFWKSDSVNVVIEPGDKLILYTDGIFECGNTDGVQWGPKSFRQNIDANANSKGSTILASLFYEAYAHFDGNPPDDDITVVVAEVSKNWKSSKKVA